MKRKIIMIYNPDYIDDRACREIREQEQEMIREMEWRTEREIKDTRTLCEQIRELTQQLKTIA